MRIDNACDLFDAGIGVRDVAWERASGESFARGVAPGARDVIIYAGKSEISAGGEGGKGSASREDEFHICHLVCVHG